MITIDDILIIYMNGFTFFTTLAMTFFLLKLVSKETMTFNNVSSSIIASVMIGVVVGLTWPLSIPRVVIKLVREVRS
jgi:hypothetical protein